MDVSVGTRLRVLRKDAGLTQASWRRWPEPIRRPSTGTKQTGQRHLTVFWSGMPPILMYRWIISSACVKTPRAVCLCHAGGAQEVVQRKPDWGEFVEACFTPGSELNRRLNR